MNSEIALEIKDLRMHFPITTGLLRKKIGEIKAVDGISLTIRRGEILGLCGESGCGKTTLARCLDRLYKPTGGEVIYEGIDISRIPDSSIANMRSNISMVFQDSYSSFDPRQNVRDILLEPLKVHRLIEKSRYHEKAAELLRMVGLDPSLMNRYPHELSGGQRQRIGIARALAPEPSLIIFDEPLSALDVSLQAQIISLLRELHKSRNNLTYILISHDLSVLRQMCDRVAVLYLGRIVEIGDTAELYHNPLHPYTRMLLSAVSMVDPFAQSENGDEVFEQNNFLPDDGPAGCAFLTRCPQATVECSRSEPQLREVGGGQKVACEKIPFGMGLPAERAWGDIDSGEAVAQA